MTRETGRRELISALGGNNRSTGTTTLIASGTDSARFLMSATTKRPEAYQCAGPGCESDFRAHEAVDGSYCSEGCSLRDGGQNLLQHLQCDHRFCHSCFRRLKEIERPPMDAPEFVIGWQHRTTAARLGQLERNRHRITDEDGAYRGGWRTAADAPADRAVRTGTICQCGATDHRDDYQRETHLVSIRNATERLLKTLEQLGREGQHDAIIDAVALARTVRQCAESGGDIDWALAVGRGLDA